MKTYYEMANDVFRRRDAYEAKQKQKQKTIRYTAALFSCFCLIALAGIGIWQSDKPESTPPTDSVDTDAPGTANQAENVIVINALTSVSASRTKIDIPLLSDDFVPTDKSTLKEYYGTNIFPTVPDDLQEEVGENGYGIYKRNGGTGEVYWDSTVIHYTDVHFSRSVNIEVKKGSLPVSDYGTLPDDCRKSTINGVEVGIGQDDGGCYLVEFMVQNVGFRMVLEGLSQEEMLTVVASLIP